jgi:hypothetical protein
VSSPLLHFLINAGGEGEGVRLQMTKFQQLLEKEKNLIIFRRDFPVT